MAATNNTRNTDEQLATKSPNEPLDGAPLVAETPADIAEQAAAPTDEKSEEESAWTVPFLFYPWITPLISRSKAAAKEGRPITADELLKVPAEEEVHKVYYEQFKPLWDAELASPSDGKAPRLGYILRKAFGHKVYLALLLKVFADATQVLIPLVLRVQVNWITKYVADPGAYEDRMYQGYLLSVAMGAMTIFMTLNQNGSAFYCSKAFTMMRTSVMMSIFDKATTLSGSHGVGGKVTQMHATDSSKFIETSIFFLNLFTAGPILIGAVIALYFFIGHAAWIALAVSVLTVPPQLVSAKGIGESRGAAARQGDKRVQKVNEFVQGIRIIKFMSWEERFEETTEKARQKEVDHFKDMQRYRANFMSLANIAPVLITFVTFATAYGFGNDILGADVFAAFAMLNVIRTPLTIVPFVGAKVAELVMIIGRIQGFLVMNEHVNKVHNCPEGIPDRPNAAIYIPDATVQYDTEAALPGTTPQTPAPAANFAAKKPDPVDGEEKTTTMLPLMTIRDLEIPKDKLTVVIGATASGKSVLISTIVGETDLTENSSVYRTGSLAYVAQEAWIMNETLKGNILMGKPYDDAKYKQALLACQLKSDLDQLPGSDATEIGERGINLSGGQKQRVAFARAVYSDRDIILMDDPLSAVDPHVCGALFHGCIRGALKGRTRVLVTHQQQFLRWADNIILVAGLQIVFQGSYDELMTRKDLKPHMAAAEKHGAENHEESVKKSEDEDEVLAARLAEESKVADTDFAALASTYTVPLPQPEKMEGAVVPTAGGATKGTSLMSKEDVKQSEGFGIFFWYYKQGGIHWFLLLVLLFSAWRAALGINDYILTWWASRAQAFDRYTFTTIQYLYWYAILGGITSFFTIVRMIPFVISVINACRAVHGAMIHRLLHAPMSYFDTTPAGRILSRTGKDMEMVDIVVPETLSVFYNIFLNVLGAWIVQAIAAWFMPIVYVVVLIIFFFLFSGYIAANHDVKFMDAVLRSPCMSIMNETLGGLATLRAYSMIENYRETHARRVHAMNRSTYCWRNLQRWLGVRTDFLSALLIMAVGIIVIGTLENLSDASRRSNLPSISLALTYVVMTTPAIGFLTNFLAELVAAFSAVERVKEYMEQLPQERALEYTDGETVEDKETGVVSKAPQPPTAWPAKGGIQFDHVFLRYRDGLDLVLKDVSFNVKPGEKVGVVGRTGSGKSTVMLSLFRMIETAKNEGGESRILIDGIDISHVTLHDLRTKITIIPQDPLLFQGTVRSNLDPFGEKDDATIWSVLEKAKLDERVRKEPDGLDCVVADRGQNFSAGERQLLCLARALLKNCRVLLLDEATASIDPMHDQIVQETIRREFADRTVLTIAHRLGTIIDSDKVLVLEAGRVLEFAHPHDLLNTEGGAFRAMVHELGAEEESRLRSVASAAKQKVLAREKGEHAPF